MQRVSTMVEIVTITHKVEWNRVTNAFGREPTRAYFNGHSRRREFSELLLSCGHTVKRAGHVTQKRAKCGKCSAA